MLRKIIATAALAAGIVGAIGTAASADHPHRLETPGTCVDKHGAGFGTGQEHSDNSADPGDTTFHERFHKGQPGVAMMNPRNPVSVVGGSLCGEQ